VATVVLPELPFPLNPSGSPPCQHRIEDGALTLVGAAGTDLFVDPSGTAPAPDASRLTGPPPAGDFMLSARVTVGFTSAFDAGVLLVEAPRQRWAKLCFEFSPHATPTAVTVVTRDFSDDCNSFEVAGQELWLRVTRIGRAWAFHASTEGQSWRLLRYFTFDDLQARAQQPDPVRVGFLAQSPTGNGCAATFSQITWCAGAPADLRDGS
jgi:uncharacterized protein